MNLSDLSGKDWHDTMLTFEQIAALTPLRDPRGRTVNTVLHELNTAIAGAGVEFGESEFSGMMARLSEITTIDDYRWIDVAAVRGGNEGYYIHITLVPVHHGSQPSRLISTAKTWTWASALEIVAVATRLLDS